MVKTVLGVNHSGLQWWYVQRISAVVMAIYLIAMVIYLVAHPQLTFNDWQQLFTCQATKVATVLFLLSILLHAWIGTWTVVTDYIYFAALRFTLHIIVLLALIACFFWGLQILWGI